MKWIRPFISFISVCLRTFLDRSVGASCSTSMIRQVQGLCFALLTCMEKECQEARDAQVACSSLSLKLSAFFCAEDVHRSLLTGGQLRRSFRSVGHQTHPNTIDSVLLETSSRPLAERSSPDQYHCGRGELRNVLSCKAGRCRRLRVPWVGTTSAHRRFFQIFKGLQSKEEASRPMPVWAYFSGGVIIIQFDSMVEMPPGVALNQESKSLKTAEPLKAFYCSHLLWPTSQVSRA